MSDLYNPIFNRSKYGDFNRHKNYASIVGGTDAYFLEDEYNESQWIQNEARAEILRLQYHSGIVEKSDNDIIVQTNDKFKPNLFSVKKMVALINGYMLQIAGNLGNLDENYVIKESDINNIILTLPPTEGKREDFVYLEMWFSELDYRLPIWYNGNRENYNGTIENDIMDERINGETCRRIQIQWGIRIAENTDFKHNNLVFNNVLARGNSNVLSTYKFWRSDSNADGKSELKDKGLWVAGNGIPGEMGTTNGYVYAIPLFQVTRRNSGGYSEENPNGAVLFAMNTISDRPDGKYADITYIDDITDLRNNVNSQSVNFRQILQRNFQKLLTGQLQSTQKPQIIKEYFGINPIIPDSYTKVYVSCNNNMKNIDKVPLEQGTIEYHYVPSIEQEGIVLDDNCNFVYDIYSAINAGYVTMMLKILDSNDKNLWSFTDIDNSEVLSCNIKDGQIIIKDKTSVLTSVFLSDTSLSINEFGHIAISWSKDINTLFVIVNGNIIQEVDITGKLQANMLEYFILGYSATDPLYCKNVILDEIEYSVNPTTTFLTLPKDFISGNAKLCIDMQYGRRTYTNTANKSIMTIAIESTSDASGNLEFSLDSPIGSVFSTMTPRLYHDNEAEVAGVVWSGLGTGTVTANLTGLGATLDYNFILVYEAEFDIDQGLNHLPVKVYKVSGERNTFYAVRNDKKFEQYPITKIYASNQVVNPNPELAALDLFYVYKPGIINELGFSSAIKYHVYGNGSNTIIIPRTLYNQQIISIYDANVVNSVDYRNLVKSFEILSNSIRITLTSTIPNGQIIEIIGGTMLPNVVYNYFAGGIENLTQVEKIELVGNGSSKEFTVRLDNRVLNSLGCILNGTLQSIAIVNNKPVPVTVTFKDTFVKFVFANAPINKSTIAIYVNTEYKPMRSERFMIWYETMVYQGENEGTYVSSLNNSDIINDLASIFVITEGLNVPLDGLLNKNHINSINLPTLTGVDTKLVPSKIIDEATNIRIPIDYAIMNDNDFNDSIPVLNKLKLIISNSRASRGFTGYVSVDNKSLYSTYKFVHPIPHLNILPLLIKDCNDKLKMAIITTYSEGNDIKIDAEYKTSAFDVFNLDENILLK